MTDLLNCPFCGGDAHYQIAWGVKCRTCGAGVPCRGDEMEQWNRRSPDLQELLREARAEGMEVAASLAAAISLLERGGKVAKKAAGSDKMFDQMLADFRKSLADFRAATIRKGEKP